MGAKGSLVPGQKHALAAASRLRHDEEVNAVRADKQGKLVASTHDAGTTESFRLKLLLCDPA